MSADAPRAAERAARDAYGRMVALLACQWRDLAAAQDALGTAFALALERWPRDGVPEAPQAWLLTVARRDLLQAARHHKAVADPAVQALFDDEPIATAPVEVPDTRLRLMFVCAHAALPEAVHAPLMLQSVLGLDAKLLANVFLVSPSAMAQRLVRAKAKIKDAGIRFEEPEARELPQRVDAVLEAIYGAYTLGKQAGLGLVGLGSAPPNELTDEALYLGRLVCALLPDSAEALGLLSLMLHSEARRPAQVDSQGRFVPLLQHDPRRWRPDLMREAESLLWRAHALRQSGRFQLEAAIQSAHAQRLATGQVPWPGIAQLYATLVLHFPSIGARVGQAVAQAEAGDAAAALATLQAIPAATVVSYAPYWVALAHVLRKAGRAAEAQAPLHRAIGLTESELLKRHLMSVAAL